MQPILEVDHLGLCYTLRHEKYSSIKGLLTGFRDTRRKEHLWAVHDLSFSLERGQSLGVIGDNGSGKSSLLKVLSGVLPPSSGKVLCSGRVAALLELGVGFHPELTGIENILLLGSVLGVPRSEMRKRIPRIAAFAEIEKFIDVPIKNYSTGMYMRLGFAIAIDVEPDILMVDEVLAVGDQAFQGKCYHRIEQMKREGVSIILVSHDLGTIERFCELTLWIEKGNVRAIGDSHEVIGSYLQQMNPQYVAINQETHNETVLLSAPEIKEHVALDCYNEVSIVQISISHSSSGSAGRLPASEPFSLFLDYKAREDMRLPTIRLKLCGATPDNSYQFDSFKQKYYIANLAPEGRIEFSMPGGVLPVDSYRLSIEIASAQREEIWCSLDDCAELNIEGETSDGAADPVSAAMFRVSHDPFAMSRCCRFHFSEADLREDFATISKGWHEVEFHGLGQRWTEQETEWVIHNPEGRNQLLITVQAGYRNVGDKPLVGEVWQDSQSLGKFVIANGDCHELSFILKDLQQQYSHLKMKLSDVIVAGEATDGVDKRRIGLAVFKIRLI
jgi:homopolymeric O-antigen transport system ATP-binding protein